MDMIKFTSAMLDAIEHCAREAKIDPEWTSVCVADMRDAYDLLTRKLARSTDPSAQAKGVLIGMAIDGNISELTSGRPCARKPDCREAGNYPNGDQVLAAVARAAT